MINANSLMLHGDACNDIAKSLDDFIGSGSGELIIGFATESLREQLATSGALRKKNCMIASSCLGSGNQQCIDIQENSISLLRFDDPEGCYGVAARSFNDQLPQASAAQATLEALTSATMNGRSPKLIWCMQTPGYEESVIEGIQSVVGQHIPIFGGTCADNNVVGRWWLYANQMIHEAGIAIAIIDSSSDLFGYFSNGYELTQYTGRVTAVDGRRLIELDNVPALEYYNGWRSNLGLSKLTSENIEHSSLTPLARIVRERDDHLVTLLSHPAAVHDTALELFSQVHLGDHVYLAVGSPDKLASRAGEFMRVAQNIAKLKNINSIKCAIIILCGGYMLNVKDALPKIHQDLHQALGDTPYIIGFTFGEQGAFTDNIVKHGNLMLSCVLFGDAHE